MRVGKAVVLTEEQAEALRRGLSDPDIFSGPLTSAHEVLRELLVVEGLMTKRVRPYGADDRYEIVTYDTTPVGRWVLNVYERQRKRNAEPSR